MSFFLFYLFYFYFFADFDLTKIKTGVRESTSPAAVTRAASATCAHCAHCREECILPVGRITCMRCKERKVGCSLSLGRKRSAKVIADSDEETERPNPKRRRVETVQPRAGRPSVEVPEGARGALSRLADSVGGLNRFFERWVGLFERQVLAQELLAGSIDRLVSVQVRERPGPHEPE